MPMKELDTLDPICDARKRGWALDAAVALAKKRKGEVSAAQLVTDANEMYQFLLKGNSAKVLKLKTIRGNKPCKLS